MWYKHSQSQVFYSSVNDMIKCQSSECANPQHLTFELYDVELLNKSDKTVWFTFENSNIEIHAEYYEA